MQESLATKVSLYSSMLISGIFSFYFMIKDSGPYRFLAELQAEYLFDGSYYPKYTFVLLFVIIAALSGLIIQPISKMLLKD